MQERSIQPKSQNLSKRLCAAITSLTVMAVLGNFSVSLAAEDQSYNALMNWFEQHREAPPAFTAGQDLDAQRSQGT